jgi:hypothetical protein
MAARHRTHIPVSIPRARRISKGDIGTHQRAEEFQTSQQCGGEYQEST